MISNNSNFNVNFSGKSFRDLKKYNDFFDDSYTCVNDIISKGRQVYKQSSTDTFINKQLVKRGFSYSTEDSISLTKYQGPTNKSAGLSTEPEYGGGYLSGSLDKPLSTADVFTCAVAELVDTKRNEHFLFHVLNDGDKTLTNSNRIEEFLQDVFPKFNQVNIFPGNQLQTKYTVKNILTAIKNIKDQVYTQFYHSPVENPEVIAHGGGLKYLERKTGVDGKAIMSFDVCKNNCY